MNAYKAHEIRMWTIQVIIPAGLLGLYVWNETDLFSNTKRKLKERKLRKESRQS